MSSTLIATPHPGMVAGIFTESLVNLMSQPDNGATDFLLVYSGPDLFKTRNRIVNHFLEITDHDYLMFIDSDMGFPADTLYWLKKIIEDSGPPPHRLVASALYFGHNELPGDPYPTYAPYPHMYKFDPTTAKYQPANGFDTNALIKVDAVGAGCLLIPRTVLETIDPDPFSQIANLGEDFSFCSLLSDYSIPLFVHSGIKTAHYKSHLLTEAHFIDFWKEA